MAARRCNLPAATTTTIPPERERTVETMVALHEITWEQVADPTFGSEGRQRFRAALTEIAAKARAKLPDSTSRIDKAVALVLAGDVVLGPQGTATVASQHDSSTRYDVRPGFCSCRD